MAIDLERQLVVRKLEEADIPAIVPLLQATFGSWPKVPTTASPLDHLRWKLGDGRPGHQSHYVAELDGRIVAFQLNLHWRMKVGAREMVARRGWDSAVHPEYQRKGVMSIMRPAMHTHFDVTPDLFLGGSGHPASPRLHEKGNETRLIFGHRWRIAIRPLTARAAMRAFKLRRGRPLRKLAFSVSLFIRWLAIEAVERFPRRDGSLKIRTIARFDESVEPFCQAALAPFDFASLRSADLLNWRYADARAGAFTIRLFQERGQVVGYSVLRVANGSGHIADLLALPGRDDVVLALARDAASRLRGAVPAIECWLFENSPYMPALRRAGFLGRRTRRQLTYEAVGAPETEVQFLGDKSTRVHLSLGDMDYV